MLAIRLDPDVEKRLDRLDRLHRLTKLTGQTKIYDAREAILEHLAA